MDVFNASGSEKGGTFSIMGGKSQPIFNFAGQTVQELMVALGIELTAGKSVIVDGERATMEQRLVGNENVLVSNNFEAA